MSIGRALEREGRAHDSIVVRTRIIDERLAIAIAADRAASVVMLGAGLDARAFRFALPRGLRWVEIDHAETIAWKRERLSLLPKTEADYSLHAADLRDADAVARLLDDVPEPIVAVLEGVLPYLLPVECDALLAKLTRKRVTIVFDIGGGVWGALAGVRTARVVAKRGAPFRMRVGDPGALVERHGFRLRANVSLIDWDEASSNPRFRFPWTARLVPGYRDVARVIEASTL